MGSQALNKHNTTESGVADSSSNFQRELIALIPQLRAFSRMLCGGRAIAEDMAQEALVKAWQSRASFEPGSNLKAWLFTILRNAYYSHTRRSWRETHWDADAGEHIPGPGNVQESSIDLCDTTRALGELPRGQREALILVGAGGFSYQDAAKVCGTVAGTVKSRVSRGRAALLDILDGHKSMPPRLSLGPDDSATNVLAQLSALTTGAGA